MSDTQRRRIVTVIGLLALLSSGACQPKEQNAERDGVETLQTATVENGDITRLINASGKIEPKTNVLVGSEVSGKLIEVNVDFNDDVKAGDVLARIDPQTFENQIEQLTATLRTNEANLKVAQARLKKSDLTLKYADLAYVREKNLLPIDGTSQVIYEEAEKAFGLAEADRDIAQANFDSAKADQTRTRAQLKTARFNLSRTTIVSPIDGVVIERKVDPGQTVQASFSAPELFKIAADLSEIEVQASVVENDVAGLGAGDEVTFSVDAYPDKKLTGRVEQLRLNSAVENNIVTYKAIVKAANPDGILLPGMTANLQIVTDVNRDILRLTSDAERFRPTREQIESFGVDDETQAPTVLAPTFAKLEKVVRDPARLETIKDKLETSTAPMREIINDPKKAFMRDSIMPRLSGVIKSVLSSTLSSEEMAAYADLTAKEGATRSGTVWVLSGDNKMKKVPVTFGLSDGAFVQIIAGLAEGDKVITRIAEAPETGGQK